MDNFNRNTIKNPIVSRDNSDLDDILFKEIENHKENLDEMINLENQITARSPKETEYYSNSQL